MAGYKEFSTEEVAGFNGSLATLERIDIVIRNCIEADFHDDVMLQKKCLISWFKRISPYLKEEEFKHGLSTINNLENEKIERNGGSITFSYKLKQLLNEFEIWLEQKSFKYNLTMMKGDRTDPRFAMMNDTE